MSLPIIVQQVVAQLYFLDYKRDTPAFAMQFPLLGLARDFPRLDSAHAKRTQREHPKNEVTAPVRAFFKELSFRLRRKSGNIAKKSS